MDGLLSLLLFAGFFYLIMRFGCGAHMVHGRHGNHKTHSIGSDVHIDPVCGKTVDAKEGYGKMHYGKLQRFCSRTCLDKFEADPEHYLHLPSKGTGGVQ